MTSHNASESSAGVRLTVLRRDVILEHATEQLHFPFLYESRDGTWYMTYREGPHGPFGGDRVQCALSHDRGRTWEPYPGLRAGTFSLRLFYQALSDGTLLANRYQSLVDESGKRTMEMLRSGDDGCVWLEHRAPLIDVPAELEGHDVPLSFWGQCVEVEPGSLVQGFYGQHVPESERTGRRSFVNGVFESTDMGQSWRFLSYICADSSLGRESPTELDLEVLPNGDLLSVFRTGGPIFMSRSEDKGETWSPAEDMGVTGVSPQLLLLQNKVLIMSYGTRDVYVRVSPDGLGSRWTKPVLLYKGPGSGYTHLQALGPDRFRVVFDESPFADKVAPGGKIMRVALSVG